MTRKFFGFTLGEILIALGVIGVVASLTLPQIINDKKASEAQAQFTTAYAEISKAINEMEVDNVPIEPANYTKNRSFYPVFKQYFKVVVDKGYSTDGKTYKYFKNKNINDEDMKRFGDGHFVINNGMDIFIYNSKNSKSGLVVWVDINGNNKLPNTLGYDLFGFELMRGGQFMPLGSTGTTDSTWAADPKKSCKYDADKPEDRGSGATCSLYAVSNSDYFKTLYKGH